MLNRARPNWNRSTGTVALGLEGESMMEFGTFKATAAIDPTYRKIKELGLDSSVMDLETYGFTVVPPEKVAPVEFLEGMRDTVLRLGRERTGVDLNIDENGSPGNYLGQPQIENQFLLYYLLMADPIFEEWLLNPTLYTLIDYLMQGSQQISSVTSFFKWKGEGYGAETLGLHSDCPTDRDGKLPACSDVANAAYCLTNYSREDGAIAMVPGSHRYCRQPRHREGVSRAVPVEAEAGSLILWHGNTWHGAYPKESDGLRLNVTTYHCHRRLKNQENYQWRVTQEMLDRNPPEFARLVAADDQMGWDERGPDYARNRKYGRQQLQQRMAEQ
jgi:hypothetical protein|tara:strand:+ start:175 stop:1164 length:990 start_codon:yes stop_codon:yes gene_type:complete